MRLTMLILLMGCASDDSRTDKLVEETGLDVVVEDTDVGGATDLPTPTDTGEPLTWTPPEPDIIDDGVVICRPTLTGGTEWVFAERMPRPAREFTDGRRIYDTTVGMVEMDTPFCTQRGHHRSDPRNTYRPGDMQRFAFAAIRHLGPCTPGEMLPGRATYLLYDSEKGWIVYAEPNPSLLTTCPPLLEN